MTSAERACTRADVPLTDYVNCDTTGFGEE
jgi:hypothetical protein